jgi:ribosomal protein S18 acetylase RimI-like enzyme
MRGVMIRCVPVQAELERAPLRRSRLADAADLAARAFHADPLFQWLFPEASVYAAQVRDVMHALLAVRVGFGSAYVAGGEPMRGVLAVEWPGRVASTLETLRWLGPALLKMAARTLGTRDLGMQFSRGESGLNVLGALHEQRPKAPHLYITVLSVEPTLQRTGIGGMLLRQALFEADRQGVPAHLETAKPANVDYYRRFGFEVLQDMTRDGCPPVYVMQRAPRQEHLTP